MEYVVGTVLGIVIGVFATVVGLDRDRALYPTAMIVIASYYDLFAVMGGTTEALVIESVIAMGFVTAATIGCRKNLWLVAGAILFHGITDLFHTRVVMGGGVPSFWPGFCASIDIVLGIYLAWLLYTGKVPAAPRAPNAF
jgi:hypothetical protein